MASAGEAEEGAVGVSGALSADDAAQRLVADSAPLPDAPAAQALDAERLRNAVAFLSHPKVRGSSRESKTAFLERKGLRAAEIEEAFRRVPQGAAAPAEPEPSFAQPGAVAPRKPFPTGSALQPAAFAGQLQQQQAAPPAQPYRWSQALIGASILAAGAYAVKQLLGPYAVAWYRRLQGAPPAPEPAEANQRTAEIVAAAIQSQTAELRATVEGLRDMLARLEKGKGVTPARDIGPAQGLSVGDLRAELAAFAATVGGLGGQQQPAAADSGSGDSAAVGEQLRELRALLAERLPAAAPVTAPAPPQRQAGGGYNPYSAGPPVPNGGHSLAPPAARFTRPQESGQQQQQQPQQPSYMEVLEMLEKGQTPANVRTDIDDSAPNPSQALPAPRAQPRPKPWEQGRGEAGPGSAEQQAGVTITEIEESSPSRPSTGSSWKPPPIPQASLKQQQQQQQEAGAEQPSQAADDS